MRHYFESAVFALLERIADGCYGVAAVGVARDVLKKSGKRRKNFVNALNANFDSSAAIAKHIVQMRLQTIVRTRFNRDGDTFGLALLTVSDIHHPA